MAIRTVILDFDGTCTDVERESVGFTAAYKRQLAALLQAEDFDEVWADTEARVLADPDHYGMVLDGRRVAPPVDPYLVATTISLLLAPDLDTATTEKLFVDNYRHTTTAFKPETKAVIEALAASDRHVFVVTNSDPATVGAKLDALAPRGREAIGLRGNARKFLVAEPVRRAGHARFENVPETLAVADWGRPVFLRRGHYFDALQAVWEETGTTPEETVVIGDVFELDLALPGALGCAVHLVESPRSLDYERRGTLAFGGRSAPDLTDVLAYG